MIEKIIPDRISLTLPTVFGEELTFLEFCGKLRAKLNECIDVVNEDTANIQQNATAISRNESDIVKLNGVVNSISAQADDNTVNINTVSGKVDKNTSAIQQNAAAISKNTTDIQKNTSDIQQNASAIQQNTSDIQQNTSDIQQNTSDIQQNTANIQQNATAISRNESDIVKLNGVVNSISAQADENTVNINTVSGKVDKNTTDIQQNTANISKNELSIAQINAAFDILRTDFLKQKAEALFAPVILNVDPHSFGADINASAYVRISRINYNVLGCLYAKVNLSFSGATDAKILKINSIQFGDRKAADITSVSTSFTAKTDVINLPISIVGSADIPVGTSDISVTGINLLGMSIVAESLDSSFALDSIPTGIDIPCESLAFTSPAGGEEDSKIIYTFKASEGCFDIFMTAAGIPAISARAFLHTDFTNVISNQKVFSQFICQGGSYNGSTISSVSTSGAPLGAALINYTEYGEGGHLYNARITERTINSAGEQNFLSNTGIASQPVPYGKFAHISLTFDMFN